MKKRLSIQLAALLLLALVPLRAMPQQTAGWTFAGFQATLMKLDFHADPASSEDATILAMEDDLAKIRSSYTNCYGYDADTEQAIAKNLDQAYSISMAAEIDALNHLPDDKDARRAILDGVRNDLDVKARFAAPTMGSISQFPSTVAVLISVNLPADGSIKAARLSIHINSCHRGNGDAGTVLGNGAGDIHTTLSPGCFVLWAQDGDKRFPPMTQPVGLTSDRPQKIFIQF